MVFVWNLVRTLLPGGAEQCRPVHCEYLGFLIF
jgi:hypothetical protein